MAITPRDVLNDDTTDAGFDIALDTVASVSADVPISKIMLGAAGTNDGLVSSGTPMPVDGSGVTQPVSAASLPLPTGAATSANQSTANTALSAIQTATELIDDAVYTDGTGTPSKGVAVMGTDGTNPQIVSTNTSGHVNIADGGNTITVDGTVGVSGTVTVDGSGVTQPVSGTVTANAGTNLNTSALALESGGNLAAIATDAAAIESLLTTIEGNQLPDGHNVTVDNGAGASAVNVQDGGNSLTVDNNGTFAVQADAFPSTVHSADFDTGAGTDTTLAFGIAVPASGGAAVVPGSATAGLKVDLGADNDVTVTGSVTANAGTNLNTSALALESGGNLATIAGAVSGTEMQVDVVSSALPTGAATAANQTTIIGHVDGIEGLLTTIDGDTSTLAAAVSGTEMQVDVVTSALPTGAATSANQSTAITALQLIDDPVFADDAAFTIGTSKVMMAGATVDEASTDSADEGDAVAMRATANRQLVTTVRPNASGEGLDIFRSIDLDESEEEVKASAGKLYGYYFYNASSSLRYLKFYNATAANVTVGTTTPVLTLPLPATSAGHVEFTNGIPFSTAICAAATTGLADNDTGAPGANEVILNAFYK